MNAEVKTETIPVMNAEPNSEVKTGSNEHYTWWQISIAAALMLIFLFILWVIIGLAVNNPLYKMYYITSGSMSPAINPGDVICLEPIKEDTVLNVGDIITFKYRNSRTTHRIAEIASDGRIFTKGDANNTMDSYEDNWVLTKNNVIGRYVMRVPLVGYVVSFIRDVFGSGAYLSASISVDGNMMSVATPPPLETVPEMMAPVSPPPEFNPIQPAPMPSSDNEPSETPETTPEPEPSETPETTPEPSELTPAPKESEIPEASEAPEESLGSEYPPDPEETPPDELLPPSGNE